MKKTRAIAIIAIGLAIMFTLSGFKFQMASKAATKASKLSGSITLWSMWNETEPQADVMKEAISDFKAANPDVNVNVQWNGREIRKTLKAALDGGQNIDIYEGDPQWLLSGALGKSYALKLDSYYDKAYTTTNGKVFKSTLIPSLVKNVSTFSNNTGLYAVPNQPCAVAIFYNKQHFQKAKINKVPQNWSEFLDACKKLKAAGYIPLTVDDAYMDILMGQYLGLEKGDEWVTKLMRDKTGKMWKDPAVIQFAAAYEQLYKLGYISKNAGSNKYPAGQQELALGKVSMYLNGSWLPNEVSATTGPDFRWGVFAYPNVPNAAHKNTEMIISSQGYAISKNCKDPDTAFELITYFLSSKAQREFVDKAASMPAIVNEKWSPALADLKPLFEKATKSMPWACGVGDGGDFTSVALSEFTKLISGKVNALKFVNDLSAAAKK